MCESISVCKYLNVLHHVPQLHQELLGLGGSVRKAVESLRQLTLHRGQRTVCKRCSTAVKHTPYARHTRLPGTNTL